MTSVLIVDDDAEVRDLAGAALNGPAGSPRPLPARSRCDRPGSRAGRLAGQAPVSICDMAASTPGATR